MHVLNAAWFFMTVYENVSVYVKTQKVINNSTKKKEGKKGILQVHNKLMAYGCWDRL